MKVRLSSLGELLEQMEEGELRVKSYLAASPRVKIIVERVDCIKDAIFHHIVERDEFDT